MVPINILLFVCLRFVWGAEWFPCLWIVYSWLTIRISLHVDYYKRNPEMQHLLLNRRDVLGLRKENDGKKIIRRQHALYVIVQIS